MALNRIGIFDFSCIGVLATRRFRASEVQTTAGRRSVTALTTERPVLSSHSPCSFPLKLNKALTVHYDTNIMVDNS